MTDNKVYIDSFEELLKKSMEQTIAAIDFAKSLQESNKKLMEGLIDLSKKAEGLM